MAVHVHRSERTDTLLRGLGDLLRTTPADPFQPDLVAVPTRGIERFIAQGLAGIVGVSPGRGDGVCANVDFPSPAAMVNSVVAQSTGVDPRTDPWPPVRSVWPLLAVIDRTAAEPWCLPLARHLGLEPPDAYRRNRRFAVASRIARLFDDYAAQRPGMLLAWTAGADTDGAGAPVPDDLAWQPPLWRALREEIGIPSLAERLETACEAVRANAAIVDLPPRLSVFGATRLPVAHLQVLAALGRHRDVHLWLADASPQLWSSLPPGTGGRRREETSAGHAANPLLRSLGRDARELHVKIDENCPADTDECLSADLSGEHLLAHLQRQIRDDQDPRTSTPVPADRSLQVHGCHGQARQAEVLREVLLGLLQEDPTLEPRDILVMCPDLDTFAPLISAAFSTPDTDLRVRIADRTPEQANALLGVLAALLDMMTGRAERSTVLDFAALAPVRERFGFDDDALERLERLTASAGIRWGLDEQHREQYSVRLETGTWTWGVDRLLLGTAMSEDGLPLLEEVLPVDDVNSGDVEVVGQLAELVTRLRLVRDDLRADHPVAAWTAIIGTALQSLTELRPADAWQLPNALGLIGTMAVAAGDHARTVDLSLTDLRWLLADVLTGRPTRSNFRSGDLTVCGLAPMRSVPHRVICLVGMDDGEFPRTGRTSGDDVTGRDPLVGERDARSEDQQVLLDALMAAGDTLVITYTGADERTNEEQPPCVPLGDLLDTVDAMTGGTGRAQLLVRHPLQPFDARNFTAGVLGTTGPFSHDRAALAAAQRSRQERVPVPTLLVPDLAPQQVDEVSLQDLARFFSSPPAAFLRSHLGISLRTDDQAPSEHIPVELGGLEKWAIGDRYLGFLLRGMDRDPIEAAERSRGHLPPGALGTEVLHEIHISTEEVAQNVALVRHGDPALIPVAVDLPNGVRVVGAVKDVYGDAIVRATYSKLKPKYELSLWVGLVALAAARPGRRWRAHHVAPEGGCDLYAPRTPQALAALTELVDLYLTGQRSLLPFMPATACRYTEQRVAGEDAHASARTADKAGWSSKFGEATCPEVVQIWGPDQPLAVLLDQPPRPGENWFDEPSRFGMLARRVWEPILQARARS